MNAQKIQCKLQTSTGLEVELVAYPIIENELCDSFSSKSSSFIPKRIEERQKLQKAVKEQEGAGISFLKVSVHKEIVFTEVFEIYF